MADDVIYLTVDQVTRFHALVLAELGGSEGIRSEQMLASSVFQPQQSAFGEDAYASIAEKAAAYAFSIVRNHPFFDGNKRTAALAMFTFLDVNGHEFVEDEDEIEGMFVDLAAGVIDQGEFFGWVVNHVRPRTVITQDEDKPVGSG
jgi:death-on-curing protein